jgi:hypothetical protein
MHRRIAIFFALALGLGTPGLALAGRLTAVDPLTMTPPLNATFAPWSCWRNGTGIICDGERLITWENADTGLTCDGRTVYGTGYEYRRQRRYGDENGLALVTIQHFSGRDTISLQPDGSGPTISGGGTFKEEFRYGVPGDLSTRTDRYSGVDVRYNAPGYGLVFHDTGTKMFDIDDNVLMLHGQHPVVLDFDGTFAKICDAFAAIGA